MNTDIVTLIREEGWEVQLDKNVRTGVTEPVVIAEGGRFPLRHPFYIHAKLYNDATHPEIRYNHFKSMHDYMWPDTIWHYWTERRFRRHCSNYKTITYAGGANIGKSMDAAKIAILFFFANPKERTVLVASTSLSSLSSRIWGYVTNLLREAKVPGLKEKYDCTGGQSPKILNKRSVTRGEPPDTIHGMFALAAKAGDDEKVIAPWIGRHPKDGLMIILDEATDMPDALVTALPNLEKGQERYQLVAIGNSNSTIDLHGALSTPLNGWDSVDPARDTEWLTTQRDGICLFFSCYESPAIHEQDPDKQKKLAKFLMTTEAIDRDVLERGINSQAFRRFTLGFWGDTGTNNTVMDAKFAGEDIYKKSEWAGLTPIEMCAGLDIAFSSGGDKCILRLAQMGQRIDGSVVLDYREDSLLFEIDISATLRDATGKPVSAEIQIANQVIRILGQYNIPLNRLAIDATGQGRAVAEVIRLQANSAHTPIKIYAVGQRNFKQKSFDVVVKSSYDLWFAFRPFIQTGQISGLDRKAAWQLTNRKTKMSGNGQIQLQTKREYKNTMIASHPSMAHSPDEADAAALCLQAAIMTLGFAPGLRIPVITKHSFIEEKIAQLKGGLLQGKSTQGVATKKPPPTATFGTGLVEAFSMRRNF